MLRDGNNTSKTANQDFDNFELQIQPFEGQWQAMVIRSPAGDGKNKFTLPFTKDQWKEVLVKIASNNASSEEIEKFGSQLFETVLLRK